MLSIMLETTDRLERWNLAFTLKLAQDSFHLAQESLHLAQESFHLAQESFHLRMNAIQLRRKLSSVCSGGEKAKFR